MPEELIAERISLGQSRFYAARGREWFLPSAVVILLIAAAAWGGLSLLRRSFNIDAEKWSAEVEKLEKELRPDLLNELGLLSNKLGAIQEIISGHRFGSNVFVLLERLVHPEVVFSSFSYADETRKIELSGKGSSYRAVAEQIALFEADQQVESVSFGGLSLDDRGSINFKAVVILKPGILRLRPAL